MLTHVRKTAILPALLLLLCSNPLFAASSEIDAAVSKYAAGHPGQAIEILKPLAASGDGNAQYLLGNIIYGLAQSSDIAHTEDAVTWYKMAAAQDSAEANYALGVIYANQWSKSKDPQQAARAEAYYQQAADLGYEQALGPLMKIAAQNRAGKSTNSLSYTNSSFSSQRETAPKQEKKAQNESPPKQAPGEIIDLGDPIAEANKLMQLIEQLQKLSQF